MQITMELTSPQLDNALIKPKATLMKKYPISRIGTITVLYLMIEKIAKRPKANPIFNLLLANK